MNIALLIINIIALAITVIWAVRSNDLEPIAGIFILVATLIGLVLQIVRPKLKISYEIQRIGQSRLAGGPWREEFRIVIGLENKNSYKSATNVSFRILSEMDHFDPFEASELTINPKAKLEILRSKKYIIIKDSQIYSDIIINYELSSSEIKNVQKTIIISGKEIVNKVIKYE
jgi:hypothetical protein